MERGIGQLKRRFHVLHSEVRLEPQKTCKVILACAVLHNICKLRNIALPDAEDDEEMLHNEARPPRGAMNNYNLTRQQYYHLLLYLY